MCGGLRNAVSRVVPIGVGLCVTENMEIGIVYIYTYIPLPLPTLGTHPRVPTLPFDLYIQVGM